MIKTGFMKKRIQVTTSGGIHIAVAVLLRQIAVEQNAFISIKTDKKIVSVREYMKVLSLGIHENDWVDIVVESNHDEEFIISQVEKILCSGRKE